MQFQRNFKKVTGSTRNNSSLPIKHKSKGLGLYKFPLVDEVPPGYYISRIMHAEDVVTKTGKNAVEVCYKLEPSHQCYQRVNKLLPKYNKNKYYYIKQRYVCNTTPYEDFVDSVSCVIDCDENGEFTTNDVIGIEEYVSLSYQSYSNIGGLDTRSPVFYDDIADPRYINTSKQTEPEVNEQDAPKTQPTESKTDYTDDDFDDFLDDDDGWI